MNGRRSGGDGGGLQVEFHSDFAPLRNEWDALAQRTENIFATWEWSSIWWRHMGEERPLFIVTFRRSDGALVAIVPLFLASRRPVRVLRFVGHGPGDELGPICVDHHRPAIAEALRGALGSIRPRWDVLVADNLPADSAWGSIGGVARINSIPNPVIEFDGIGWDEFFKSRGSKFRQQVRRNTRRLADDHELTYRLADDSTLINADLDTLFTLHQARWRDESSGVFAGVEGAFQREFARAMLDRGCLRLWFLELDGEPVAARLGFRFGQVECGYQSGRDRSWDKYGIGFLLQAHVVRRAIEDEMKEYRLLRGGESYKGRLANAERGLDTIAFARGIAGRGALAAGRVALAMPPGSRAWLSRLSGGG